MTKTKNTASEFIARSTHGIRSFFEGNLYPALIAAGVLIGHVTALEFYFFIPIILSASVALFICETSKPFIPVLLTFVYLVNLKHSPGFPSWSDYYTRTYVVVTAAVLFSLLFISAVYFYARRIIPKMHPKKTPLFLPLTLLSAAFILNGILTSGWKPINLVFGIAEAAVFFVLFYLFYYGLEKESINRLLDYVCYVSLLAATVLFGEIIFMYLTNDAIFSEAGTLRKESISLGWGISNPIGNALVILIPMLMLGAARCRYAPVYLIATLFTSLATFMTLSRNAIILCGIILTASFITIYMMSDIRKPMAITFGTGVGLLLIAALIFADKLTELLSYFSSAGTTDSGRFKLWSDSFKNFLSAPVFGRGFFDWGDMSGNEMASFLPNMSHNTFFQLISSMGILGLGSYAYYRVKSMLPFFKRISREKLMLLYSVLVLLLGSLFDNFIFYFHSAFLYVLVLAIVFRMNDYEEEWIKSHADDDSYGDGNTDDDVREDEEDEDDDYYI